jgi:PKD repeat protein
MNFLRSIACVLIVALLSFLSCHNQSSNKSPDLKPSNLPTWVDMMDDPQVDIKEARQIFDDYWQRNERHPGDKHNKFERWYTRNVERLDDKGKIISSSQVRSELQHLRAARAEEQEGDWFNYGPIEVGPRPDGSKRDGGRVKHISFHPADTSIFYVSCFKGGLFRGEDAGAKWVPLTDQLAEEVYISQVDPDLPDVIYIGTNQGVLKTEDAGINWYQTDLDHGKVNGLVLHAANPQVVLAGHPGGIYRSENGGETFTLVLAASKVEEIRRHPTNPQIMYASTNGSPSQFFRSEDGGEAWAEITGGFGQGCFMKIAVTPAAPDVVYVINARDHLGDDSFDGVYRSDDAGLTFQKQAGTSPCITGYRSNGDLSRGQPNYNLFIVADPTDANMIYAGGVKSWRSADAGSTWESFFEDVNENGQKLHLDQLSWAYHPGTNRLYSVSDGGIYTLNDQDRFRSITDGLPIAEVWECTQSQQNITNVAGGTFHCGVKLNRDGEWFSSWGGDESTVLFDYSDDTYAYHFKYEKISRSTNGGHSFQRINATEADRGNYSGTGVLDYGDVNILYVGLFEVERTRNARATTRSEVQWTKISSFSGTQRIGKVAQSQVEHNLFYVSREGNQFYVSEDVQSDQPTFTNLTANLPVNGIVTDIEPHPTDANTVYILLGSKIYRSTDRGSNWEDISTGLPGVALLELIFDKSSNEGLYIGTDLGMFYKDASMSEWIDYSQGLPAVRVSGIDIFYGETREESILTVATDGRGFWMSPLHGISAQLPTADFEASEQEVNVGTPTIFTDRSSGTPLRWRWEFSGGSPGSSSSRQPVVFYDTPGSYDVKLWVTNTAGTDSLLRTEYITVAENSGSGPLKAWFAFDGNLKDSSNYRRHLAGTNGASPSYVPDVRGNTNMAYTASGNSNEYLTNTYYGVPADGPRTVTAWVKTPEVGSRKTVVSWGLNQPGRMFNVMVFEGNIRVEAGGCNVQNDDSTVERLDNNQWRHIAVSYDPADGGLASDVKLFIDGEYYVNQPDSGDSFNSETTSINTDTSTHQLEVGHTPYSEAYYWQGDLDDVRVYSTALSAEEITDIYDFGLTSLQTPQELSRINVFPNPFRQSVSLSNLSDAFSGSDPLEFSVYDSNGRRSFDTILTDKVNSTQLDLANLPSGMYWLHIRNGQGMVTYRMVKR